MRFQGKNLARKSAHKAQNIQLRMHTQRTPACKKTANEEAINLLEKILALPSPESIPLKSCSDFHAF